MKGKIGSYYLDEIGSANWFGKNTFTSILYSLLSEAPVWFHLLLLLLAFMCFKSFMSAVRDLCVILLRKGGGRLLIVWHVMSMILSLMVFVWLAWILYSVSHVTHPLLPWLMAGLAVACIARNVLIIRRRTASPDADPGKNGTERE